MAVTFDLTWDSPEAEEVFKKAKKIKLFEKYFYIAEKSIRSKGSGSPNVFTLKQIDDIANMMKNGASQTKLVENFQLNYTFLQEIAKAYNIKRKVRQGHLYARNDFGWKCLNAAEYLYDLGRIDTNTDEQTIRQLVAMEIAENAEDVNKKLARIQYMTQGHNDRYTLIIKEYAELKNKELSENDRRILDVLNGNLDAIAATDEDDSEEKVYYEQAVKQDTEARLYHGQADEHKDFDPELGLDDTEEDKENIEEDEGESSMAANQPVYSPTANVGAVVEFIEKIFKKEGKVIDLNQLIRIAKAYDTPELYTACNKLNNIIYGAAVADFVGMFNKLTEATANFSDLICEKSSEIMRNTDLTKNYN